MRPRSLKLPAHLDELIQQLADERQTSYSQVVREALQAYLAHPGRSALAAAGDLVGSLSGPADSSMAPEHLAGFGE